ncbi:uncharacterized protein [Amphiura filiformis]|uniref:uncharacterized protein isoform X2 n=1 Tax=Amphiura filiformis TaxID=82378 RepID=UPI003B2229CC
MERLLNMKLNDVGSSFLADQHDDDQPLRNTDYKKKGNGIDKRAMRLHRRSIDQRKMRDQTLLKQRGIEAMSPLKEVQNVTEKKVAPQKKASNRPIGKPQPKQATQTGDMKDRLKKWKEEKELKKKLTRQRQAKPQFKVHHIQYEKTPFTVPTITAPNAMKNEAKSKPASRVTRSSARTNAKPTTNKAASNKPTALVLGRPVTRQSRLNTQKEQPQPAATQKSTRTTRARNGSKSSSTDEVRPTRSTRTTRASVRAAHQKKPKDEPKQTSRAARSRSGARSSKKEEDEPKQTSRAARSRSGTRSSKKEEQEEEEESVMKTVNPFPQTSVNFERGEPTVSFLQGPSFAPVDFKFDFTVQASQFVPKTPDRRCSSTPLNTARTGIFQLPTPPQGLSAIRPDKTFTNLEPPINIPVLSLSTSSVSSGQPSNPALRSETYLIAPAKAAPIEVRDEETVKPQEDEPTKTTEADAPMDVPEEETVKPQQDEPPKTTDAPMDVPKEETVKPQQDDEIAHKASSVADEQSNELSQKLAVGEEEEPQALEVEMETAEMRGDDVVLEPESNAVAEVEMQEVPTTTEDNVVTEPITEAIEEKLKAPSTEDAKLVEKPDNSNQPKIEAVVAPACETSAKNDEGTMQDAGLVKDEEKDVPYFRRLVSSVTGKLTGLCEKWQGVMDASSLSEDVLGEIRSTAGKAQLLMDQRFKQFIGLVDDCEFDRGELKTHCTDLVGFWEMVSYQVEDVEKMFAELDKLQANNWVKEVKIKPKVKKVANKKPKATAASKKAAADRIAARQRLMAARAAMKAKATRSKDSEKVVFEGGFFKVESPVKSPKVHCQAGSPLSAAFLRRTSPTPGSKPGSRQGTPRPQAFMPSNPRLSLQSSLCTTISKLVLTESDDTVKSPSRVTRSRHGTPVSVVKPIVKTPASMSKTQGTVAPSTPLARTPATRKHRESVAHPLIPGIASPHLTTSSMMFDASNAFTPQSKTTPSTPATVNDLICLDSPLAPTLAPPLPLQQAAALDTGSVKCFAAINASADMIDLLGTDVVMSPVRRSSRLRHTSGQMVVDKLADMPEEVNYGYQPNVSLL